MIAGARAQAGEKGVRLVRDDAKQRVDVFVDGQPFTAYIYPPTGKKPVLFPIRSAAAICSIAGAGARSSRPCHRRESAMQARPVHRVESGEPPTEGSQSQMRYSRFAKSSRASLRDPVPGFFGDRSTT